MIAALDVVAEHRPGVDVLAERDRDRRRAGESRVAFDVVRIERLLEPADVELLEPRRPRDRRRRVPAAGSRRSSGRCRRRSPCAPPRRGDGPRASRADRPSSSRARQPWSMIACISSTIRSTSKFSQPRVGVVGRHAPVLVAADELPEREPGRLRLDVPQRDVDGGERHVRDA